MTNSSTVEGEHTIQGQDEVDEEPVEDAIQEIEDQQLQETVKCSIRVFADSNASKISLMS